MDGFWQAYDNYIAQVKAEQSDLELDISRPTVVPQIKHPVNKSRTSSSPASLSPSSPQPLNKDRSGLNGSDECSAKTSSASLSADGVGEKVVFVWRSVLRENSVCSCWTDCFSECNFSDFLRDFQ